MLNRRLLIATALGLGMPAAWAHGNTHAKKPGPLKREQKAWGRAGLAKEVKRSIDIRMSDRMRFAPDLLQLRLGQTARLRIHNEGKMLHELVLGTAQDLEEHAVLMLKFPDMEHDEPHMAHVAAGSVGEIVWQFNRAGEFHFACLIAGHFQAGMRGRFVVAKA